MGLFTRNNPTPGTLPPAPKPLSPEEQAVHVPHSEPTPAERITESEDDDAAALAEGRVAPPVGEREDRT